MSACGKCIAHRFAEHLNCFDSHPAKTRAFFACAKMFCFIDLIVKAVVHEVHQVRDNCLCAFLLQKFHQMIVCSGREFYEDFPDNADTRFLDVLYVNGIKISNNLTAYFFVFMVGRVLASKERIALLNPFLMHFIYGTRYGFIRAHSVNTTHKDVTKVYGIYCTQQQLRRKLKARITL